MRNCKKSVVCKMLNSIKMSKKRQPLAAKIMANMRMVTTLSDRLKQAGIKECIANEAQALEKTNKRLKKKKNYMKRSHSEKYFYNDFKNPPGKRKRLLKLQKYFFTPHKSNLNSKFSNENLNDGMQLKNVTKFSEELNKNIEGSAKQTIYVSLDFIKDCKQYKKKFRNPNGDSDTRSQRKSLGSFQGSSIMHLNNKTKFQKFQVNPEKVHTKENELDFINSNKEQDFLFEELSTELKDSSNEVGLESGHQKELSQVKSSIDKLPSNDVVKIDQKYLQSLLSLATGRVHQTKTPVNDNKSKEKIVHSNNRNLPEKKISKRNSKEKYFELTENKYIDYNLKNYVKIHIPINKKSTTRNIAKNFTKPEIQLQFETESNNLFAFSTKTKNDIDISPANPQINNQPKRKNVRATFFKSKSRNIPSSNEDSKVTDVKELWRRDSPELSDNSLTSHSSIDEIPAWKNLGLESYKILKKLVEKEIKKISKVSDKAQVKSDCIPTNKPNSVKNAGDVKIVKEQSKIPVNPNQTQYINKNSESSIKKRLKEAEYQVYNLTHDGIKEKSELKNLFTEDKINNLKAQKQLPEDNWERYKKNLSPMIENWSILNRLEKAFLALGTPTFQKKPIKNINSAKSKTVTNKGEKIQEKRSDKKNKTAQKSKERAINKGNKNETTPEENSTKTSLRSRNQENEKQSHSKEKQQTIKSKIDTKNENLQSKTIFEKLPEEKETDTEKKKAKFSPRTPRKMTVKKTNHESVSQTKLTITKLPTLQKPNQNLKIPSNDLLPAKTQFNKFSKNQSSRVLVSKKGLSKTLERKKTFDVIQVEDSSSVKSLKSESYKKIIEQEKHSSETKNQNMEKEEGKAKPNTIENKIDTETDLQTPQKIKMKEKQLQPSETPTDFYKTETCTEIQESENTQQIKTEISTETQGEKTIPIEDLEIEILERKEFNKNCSERVIKERSILSLSRSTKSTPEPDVKLQQNEEKIAPILPPLKSNTEDLLATVVENLNGDTQKPVKISKPKFSVSCLRAGTYEVYNHKVFNNFDKQQDSKQFDFSEKFTSSSSLSSYNLDVCQDFGIEKFKVQSEEESRTVKNQPLWEQDIRHYRAIVKEIMSHYNRINGFLKQCGYAENFFENSTNTLTTHEIHDETSLLSDKLPNADIYEYRKKIISEYQALPIYEYKNRLLKDKKVDSELEELNKKQLAVVKDVKTETDLDVKDYQPKIQKVLDSQLYVDTKNLAKCKEKKSSLQENSISKNEKALKKGECLRSNSIPRTYLPMPCSQTLLSISENLAESKSEDFYLANDSSDYSSGTKSQNLGLLKTKYCNAY